MIAKGTTHNDGAKLARYMTTGKAGERAELWQLLGFAAGDIRDAFRSVHVMAEATRCEQPFFHVQVRNPDGEELSREQWRQVADRIESKLGLTDQPRAICFHIDEKTGHEHMHIAFSRINGDTLTARPLPFFKERLKEACRELEKTLDLTRVRNEREGLVKAPTRNELEQARRLGVDINHVRQTIRDCFEQSDNGRSFEAALADRGLVLAQGDRRAFVVIDHEGGIHALGKRILGITTGQTRDRLGDLHRYDLPTVEQARGFIREKGIGRDKPAPERMRDPHRDEMAWLDALAKAAIEKEKVERRFVEPQARRQPVDGREKGQGGAPPPEHPKGIDRSAPARGKDTLKTSALGRGAERAVGKALDSVANVFESLFAPALTPEQKRESAERAREHAAETADKIDLSRYLSDREQASQRQEQERDTSPRRQRDERDR